MEQLFGNNPQEMLHLYLDGELNSSLHASLFSELAVNEELRNEMSELISIRSTVQNDSEAFAAPVESMGIIFNRIGLTPPIPAPVPLAGGGIISWFAKYWWAPALASIISIIGTSLVMNSMHNSEMLNLKNSYPVVSSFDKQQKVTESDLGKIANSNFNNNAKITEKTKIVYVNRYIKQSEQSLNNPDKTFGQTADEKTNSKNVNVALLEPSKNNMFGNRLNNHYFSGSSNISYSPIDLKSFDNYLKTSSKKYALYLRGLTAKSFPETDMLSATDPIFTNMSIGAYISNNKNVQFGLEFGQESFSQVFDNVENGITYQYMQNPVIFWGALGAVLRTDKIEFLAGAQPFAQFIVGGTQLGPLGKFVTGLQLNSSETGIGILIGVEGSSLLYSNQGRWYYSNKLGFTFGTSLQF